MVYTLMEYDYEQTDIRLATDKLEEAVKASEEDVFFHLCVWHNGKKVSIFFDGDEWKTGLRVTALDESDIELFNKFLKEENVKGSLSE